jgi:hypothetical protein
MNAKLHEYVPCRSGALLKTQLPSCTAGKQVSNNKSGSSRCGGNSDLSLASGQHQTRVRTKNTPSRGRSIERRLAKRKLDAGTRLEIGGGVDLARLTALANQELNVCDWGLGINTENVNREAVRVRT